MDGKLHASEVHKRVRGATDLSVMKTLGVPLEMDASGGNGVIYGHFKQDIEFI